MGFADLLPCKNIQSAGEGFSRETAELAGCAKSESAYSNPLFPSPLAFT